MIIYDGLEKKNKTYFIKFKNKNNNCISIPIDEISALRIATYLEKITLKEPIMFKHNNDEPSE